MSKKEGEKSRKVFCFFQLVVLFYLVLSTLKSQFSRQKMRWAAV